MILSCIFRYSSLRCNQLQHWIGRQQPMAVKVCRYGIRLSRARIFLGNVTGLWLLFRIREINSAGILIWNSQLIAQQIVDNMANGVSTEWFDLQVKYGNYLPNEKKPTLAEQQKLMQEKHEEENKLENKLDKMSIEKINELDDDLDFDDEFTRQYMASRMQQLKLKSEKQKYGQVIEISRDEYIREVTEADPESFVLLHLYQNYNEFCNLINQHLPVIAKLYAHVKFVKIVATKCIDKFPDERCPCFIIYKAGKPVSNLTNVDKLLKNDVANIAELLLNHGIQPL